MFDTHCHLNFKAFKKILPEVIDDAKKIGVTTIVIPGTDVKTSKKGVEIAQSNENIFAAVGIHPHHVMKYLTGEQDIQTQIQSDLTQIKELVSHSKVVAIGEIGMDRHEYQETVYQEYQVDGRFLELQKELLEKQIQLAVTYKKSLILHNREAKADLIPIVKKNWNTHLENRTVFHCCEPDEELLKFAQEHRMFIGVDGDVTYTPEKQKFMKKVPLEMLVLETDSPFLLPEPLKTERKFPNKPSNIELVAKMVSEIKELSLNEVITTTTQNAKQFFLV